MANNWEYKKLEEIAEVIDSRHKTPQYSEFGFPMVRVVDVKGGVLRLSDTKKVSKDVYNDFSKGRDPQIGDLIISRVGSYGNVAYVDSKDKFCLGQNTALIIPQDKNRFLYYALTSPLIKRQIDEMVVGAVQKTISLKTIKNLKIPELPNMVKSRVSEILSNLDDRIELNRQANQTLEQMAQALFKSWFVDFDPVIDNALDAGNPIPEELQAKAEQRKVVKADANAKLLPYDIRQLFPSEFEESELGWVPKGWDVSPLSNFIGVKHGYAYKGEFFSDEVTEDVLLTPGNVAIGGGFKGNKFKFYKGPIMAEYVFEAGDMYITMTDLSKAGDTLGYPAFVPEVTEHVFHHNQRLGKVEFKNTAKYGAEFVYQYLCSREYRNHIIASATGTTVKHTSPTKILMHKITSSGGAIEPIFEKIVKELSAKKNSNNANSRSLTKTRDLLLPQLISGKLRIN